MNISTAGDFKKYKWVCQPAMSDKKVLFRQWTRIMGADKEQALYAAEGVPLTEEDQRVVAVLSMIQPDMHVEGMGIHNTKTPEIETAFHFGYEP